MKRQTQVTAALFTMAAGLITVPPTSAAQSAPAPVAMAAPVAPAAPGATGEVTLITGDRVLLRADGEVASVVRGEGREQIAFSVRRTDDGLLVVPSDAEQLIQQGIVDQQLFNATELSRPEYQRLAGDGTPVIITYEGERPAQLFDGSAPQVRAELESINGEALTVADEDAGDVWAALTGPGTLGSASSAVATLALDGLNRAQLDTSTGQIGAPEVWEAGYEGDGVTIAVLDTGIDTSHPDLAGGKVVAQANFAGTPDTHDHFGHGTHVASIAAGTGAHSGGAYGGVAPGAELLNAKVLDDLGSGFDSGIVQGMEWAVEHDAQIVNLSLGGSDAPGIDVLEEAINRLSADSGVLFVVAAGNAGPGAVASPATADAALAVGAVDDEDALADFSGTGPRQGDFAVKPDLTAPGVAIGAAAAEGSVLAGENEPVADGYIAIGGTSMAAPHVAGAAALLLQRNPALTGEQVKAALVGSAQPNPDLGAFEQGSGRVDVASAVEQSVIAEPVSLSFGSALWPHEDDTPIARELTYRNLGEDEVTLDLGLTSSGPAGDAAPDGMFTLNAEQVTVPAGGTATVEVTVDTRLGGEVNGDYSVLVTADGDGQSVRTAGAVHRQDEHYELTIEAIGRDGEPHPEWGFFLEKLGDDTVSTLSHGARDSDGTTTLRVPPGDYYARLDGFIVDEDLNLLGGESFMQPLLEITEDTTLTFDAREGRDIDLSVFAEDAVRTSLILGFTNRNGYSETAILPGELPAGFRTRHLGPEVPEDDFYSFVSAGWTGAEGRYHTSYDRNGSFFTGLTDHVGEEDVAELTVHQGQWAEHHLGTTLVWPETGPATTVFDWENPGEDLPRMSTEFVRADGMGWAIGADHPTPDNRSEGTYQTEVEQYAPGESYELTMGVGVLGPHLNMETDLTRQGDRLFTDVDLFADGQGNRLYNGFYDELSITLYRNGEVFRTAEDGRTCGNWPLLPPYIQSCVRFDVPPDEAEYEWVTSVNRASRADVSTEVTTSLSFTSAHSPGEEHQKLPVSVVRFTPELALDNSAPAGETFPVPVTVEGTAADGNLGALSVEVSYDRGESWSELPVEDGRITVQNPAADGSVSFRAEVSDADGNTTRQTILDAYLTR
ncbi:S8 family peptidase [Streptomyces johnsoniae]|uniref:S8 family serine peptidase n=1 Tax=Streptomyces johnsoniae TaxID=3075532 RepID=A0ABU2S5R5_9ACTN|nr:S8 family serine peptidase [Streptomyces sp. DSM 41886]MDT0444031.1 S8 family serine peptidase [Streptomyces sp. DSM 41886]